MSILRRWCFSLLPIFYSATSICSAQTFGTTPKAVIEANQLAASGKLKEAEERLFSAFKGSDYQDNIDLQFALADVFAKEGKKSEAVNRFEGAMSFYGDQIGCDKEDYAKKLDQLAKLDENYGFDKKAEIAKLEASEIRAHKVPEHPDTEVKMAPLPFT